MNNTQVGYKNPIIRYAINVKNNRLSKYQNKYIIEGIRLHNRLIDSNIEPDIFFYCPEIVYSEKVKNIISQISPKSKKTVKITKKAFERISSRDRPDGILSICEYRYSSLSKIESPNKFILVLDGLEKPGNIGTIIRSLNGFGGGAVVICNERSNPLNEKAFTASCGTNIQTQIIRCEIGEIQSWLTKNNYHTFLAVPESGVEINNLSAMNRMAIVLGNERFGVSEDWLRSPHTKITIPMTNKIDSLNVAVAGSIILYNFQLLTTHVNLSN